MGHSFIDPDTRWVSAFVAALLVVTFACRLRSLTVSGAVAAVIVGTLMVGAAGWWAGLVLVTFFVTASALSAMSPRRSAGVEQVRGKRRDAVQVMANGAVPAVCAVASALAADRGPWLVAMASAVAGAAADTWATETGRFSRGRPRLITTWKPVVPGTSGAISTPGTLGALAGSVTIALVAAAGHNSGLMAGVVTAAGMAGALVDSLLGATVQAVYWCPVCGEATERPVHRCGTRARKTRGLAGMNNDTVNFVAILVSAGIGFAATAIWSVVS